MYIYYYMVWLHIVWIEHIQFTIQMIHAWWYDTQIVISAFVNALTIFILDIFLCLSALKVNTTTIIIKFCLDVFTLFFVFTFSYNLFGSCYSCCWPRVYILRTEYVCIVVVCFDHPPSPSKVNIIHVFIYVLLWIFAFACVDDANTHTNTLGWEEGSEQITVNLHCYFFPENIHRTLESFQYISYYIEQTEK